MVHGKVLDTAGAAIAGAVVAFDNSTLRLQTNLDGTFQTMLLSGDHRLTITLGDRSLYDNRITVPAEKKYDMGDLYPDIAFFQNRIVVREHGQYGDQFDDQQWCSISIADETGMAITGLGYNDIGITESLVRTSDGQVVASEVVPLKEQSPSWAYDLGLFEKSVNAEKLDIVFLTDHTSSFDDDGTDVRGEIKRFVDKLMSTHIDFRIAGVSFDETPDDLDFFDFYGPEHRDRIDELIDVVLDTAGDWWWPTCAYDALLFTPYLGFRFDARKVAVILTDIVPHTVYGTDWYAIDSSIATRSSAEYFLEHTGIELFYALFEHENPDIDLYWLPDINSRAGEGGNPSYGIEGSGLGDLTCADGHQPTRLAWPFSADDLWQKLQLTQSPIKDSRYIISWRPVIDEREVPGSLDQYMYRVTVTAKDPADPATSLTVSYKKPAIHPTARAEIRLVDEEGNPFVDAWGWLYVERSGRTEDPLVSQASPDTGGMLVFERLVPQRYVLVVTDSSHYSNGYSNLRAIARMTFDVPPEGTQLQLTVQTAERMADEALLAGLLNDLTSWRLPGSPYHTIATDIRTWLYDCEKTNGGILCNGMNWREQAALRHLNLVLGGYANLNEYSQLEAQRAVEDFQTIVHHTGRLVQAIRDLQDATDKSWKEALAEAGFRAALDLATAGQAEVLIATVESLLVQLLDYLANAFFSELVDLLQNAIITATGIDQHHPVLLMLTAGIDLYAHWNDADTSGEQNLQKLWDAASGMGLHLLFEQALTTISPSLLQTSFDGLKTETSVEKAVKPLLKELVQVSWGGIPVEQMGSQLSTWSRATGSLLASYTHDAIVNAVTALMQRWRDELTLRGIQEKYADLIPGFLCDLATMTVPNRENGTVSLTVHADDAINVLIRHTVYALFIRDRFVDAFQTALTDSTTRAQAVAAIPAAEFDRWKWRGTTSNTQFYRFRSAIKTAQQTAWDALEKQNEMHLWAKGLAGLQAIIDPLGEALDVAASVYYPLRDAADAVKAFSATLDSIQIVVSAVEFGLKLKGIEELGGIAKGAYLKAFE